MNLRISKLSQSNKSDFFTIHSGDEGWCCCAAWWVKSWDGWGNRTAAENKNVREDLFGRGEFDGYILYADERAAAWCQCCERDKLKKLVNQFKLLSSPGTWAITCFLIKSEYRKKNLSLQFLKLIIKDLKRNGITHVQSFPRCGKRLDDGDVWTGPESIYINSGFVKEIESDISPVYGIRL